MSLKYGYRKSFNEIIKDFFDFRQLPVFSQTLQPVGIITLIVCNSVAIIISILLQKKQIKDVSAVFE